MQPHTGTLMAMAHALERNRHTNSRHAHSHPEKDLPSPTRTQPDSWWLRVTVIRISETVMYPQSHPRSVQITQPCITVMAHLLQLATDSQLYCHIIPEKQSLFCKHGSHTGKYRTMYNHSPCGQTHYISHTETSARNFHFTHLDGILTATFTRKTWFRIETCMLSGDIHSVTKSYNFSKAA